MGQRLTMRALLRAGIALLFLFGLLTLTSAPAVAGSLPNPFNPGSIEEKLCPSKNAPVPEMPEDGLPAGTGDYATYGYAGLTWTTYDQSCLSPAKLDTSIGNGINDLATGIDGLVNSAQGNALDPHFTDPLRRVVDQAVPKLRDAFFDPWLTTGLAAAGLVVLLLFAFGRETEVFHTALNVFIVLGAVFFVLAAPGRISQASADATSGVAARTGSVMASATGKPISDPAQAFTESYYSMSLRAWEDGAFCYNRTAEDRWGARVRNDQAYTVAEKRQIQADPNAAKAIKKTKQDAWLQTTKDMQQQDPAAYDCWSGSTSSRFKSGIRHLITSIMAGFWVLLCAAGILILQDMLMLGTLLLIGVGAVLVAMRRATDRMFEFMILAAVGAPFVALVMGVLLAGYAVILSDPTATWLSSTILAFCLGAAIFFSWPFLRRLFLGLTAVDQSRRLTRHVNKAGALAGAAASVPLAGASAVGQTLARRRGRSEPSGDDRSVPQGGSGDTDGKSSTTGADTATPVAGDDRNGRASIPVPSTDREGGAVGDDLPDWVNQDDEEKSLVPASANADDGTRSIPDRLPRRLGLTDEEERSWREMASAQLERFGHAPMSPPPSDVYRPPPVSGDERS